MALRTARPVLCLVTPGAARRHDDRAAQDVVSLADRASAEGVDIVQLREPRLSDSALLTVARRLVAAVDGSRTAVVVNDRTDVAVAAGAAGVHLRGDAMRASRVRAVAPDGFLIGRSVHSVAEAVEAEQDGGIDYLMFGTVFPSASKPAGHPVAGLAELTDVCAGAGLQVIAIGGMTPDRARQAAAAGAWGIAAIGMFAGPFEKDPDGLRAVVAETRRAFDTRWHVV